VGSNSNKSITSELHVLRKFACLTYFMTFVDHFLEKLQYGFSRAFNVLLMMTFLNYFEKKSSLQHFSRLINTGWPS